MTGIEPAKIVKPANVLQASPTSTRATLIYAVSEGKFECACKPVSAGGLTTFAGSVLIFFQPKLQK
jgi:hypothetical protein